MDNNQTLPLLGPSMHVLPASMSRLSSPSPNFLVRRIKWSLCQESSQSNGARDGGGLINMEKERAINNRAFITQHQLLNQSNAEALPSMPIVSKMYTIFWLFQWQSGELTILWMQSGIVSEGSARSIAVGIGRQGKARMHARNNLNRLRMGGTRAKGRKMLAKANECRELSLC